jgi:hypothetical protein
MLKRLLFLSLRSCAAASAQQTTNPQQALNQVNQTFVIANQCLWNPNTKYFDLHDAKELILLNQNILFW